MNNLNDPPRRNIQPDPSGSGAGPGDGNQWNYALLVPMLGLALFRWIWTKESQKEIQKVKDQYDTDVSTLKSEIEARYQDTQTERRRAATLELDLEKEKHRVKGYEQALEQENDWHWRRATATLEELEVQLVERQNVYCSYIQLRDQRLEMEKNMLLKVDKDPIGAELDLEFGLKDIFRRDKHCADLLNSDKRKNGSLMWVYLKHWQQQVTVQKHKRAEKAIFGGKFQSPTK